MGFWWGYTNPFAVNDLQDLERLVSILGLLYALFCFRKPVFADAWYFVNHVVTMKIVIIFYVQYESLKSFAI